MENFVVLIKQQWTAGRNVTITNALGERQQRIGTYSISNRTISNHEFEESLCGMSVRNYYQGNNMAELNTEQVA